MKTFSMMLALSALVLGGCKRVNPAYCPDNPEKLCGFDGGGADAAVDMAHPACTMSMECPPDNPICDGRLCVACTTKADGGSSSECAAFHSTLPFCGPGGNCVECLGRNDCAASQKTCNLAKNVCDFCKTNGDCATGVCLDTGLCAKQSQVTFVDNRGMLVADCKTKFGNADGTSRVSAMCDVPEAIVAPAQTPFIVVAGSAQSYSAIKIATTTKAQTVNIVGPGKSAALTALISGQNGFAGVSISTGGAAATVTLDGLDIGGSGGLMKANGVECIVNNGDVKLTIRNSNVRDSGKIGVTVTDCTLILDEDNIVTNQGGGVKIAGSNTYSITNTFIVANQGSLSRGVSLDDATTGVFAFNTVASNGPMKDFKGGISCGLGSTKLIESSIIFDNTQDVMNMTQFAGNCQLVNIVSGTDMVNGTSKLVPEFVNPNDPMKPLDFHMVKGSSKNAACCIDKVGPGDGGGVTLPDHDVDGNHRPVNLLWDIGAHEQQ